MIERPLEGLRPLHDGPLRTGGTELVLRNSESFEFRCSMVAPAILRTTLTGPSLPLPPSQTVLEASKKCLPLHVEEELGISAAAAGGPQSTSNVASVRFSAGKDAPVVVCVSWTDMPVIEMFWRKSRSKLPAFSDLPFRSYNVTEHGVSRYTMFDEACIHLGLGERAAPLDLTKRSFVMAGSDSASYDAYLSDPLYKHTPFLISSPRPSDEEEDGEWPAVGILSASCSDAQWDVGRFIDEPWKMFKRYTQDWGGLDEYIILGQDIQRVVRSFADLVGYPQLVPRAWLGYLASGMGLGESDDPPAQHLLEGWSETCRKHGIPCSAMHLSSGYTVDEETGDRMVFTMNRKRYPDFAGMVKKFQQDGIAVAPNVKPYVLTSHPDFKELEDSGALFTDPATGQPVITRIWASSIGVNAKGSWIDMTSKAGRAWWRKGIASLVEQGVDAIWNDNNEYSLHDDRFLCGAETSDEEEVGEAALKRERHIGLIGRMQNTEEMARASADVLRQRRGYKRPLVLTRSANIATMRHASSSWSGDNRTSWTSLRGSVAMVLNAQISLLSSYGTDVGGFGGPQPSPELLVRWIQLGVTHPRFCIHSYKPTRGDPSGRSTTTTPWMHPSVAPAIRTLIRRRYELLPFWNDLQWRSHLYAEPCNTPLFWGEFHSDGRLYPPSGRAIQDGGLDGQGASDTRENLDYWIGTGRLLFCGQFFEGRTKRQVYLPRNSPSDDAVYYNLHAPYGHLKAGSIVEIETPLEHGGIFAREGTVLPVGKPCVTSTIDPEKQDAAILAQRGVYGTGTATPARLVRDGGVVELDDWRGVEIFPPPCGQTGSNSKKYKWQWIEDDGETMDAPQAVIDVTFEVLTDSDASVPMTTPCNLSDGGKDDDYVVAEHSPSQHRNGSRETIRVQARYLRTDFMPLWGNALHVILPRGDSRAVQANRRVMLDDGRIAWVIEVI